MAQHFETYSQLPQQAPLWLRMTESAVITFGVPLFGYWLSPDDPFFVESSFPWLMLAPLLVALRYGINAGAFSVFTLIGIMAMGWTYGYLHWDEFPLLYSVGMLVTVLVVGEFGSVWNKRINLLRAMNDYREYRLREFTHAYNLIKQSHDGLEQRLAANSTSLRGCLISVRKEVTQSKTGTAPLYDFGPLILRLFGHYGNLQSASILYVDKAGRVDAEPLATLGDPDPVSLQLRLVSEALESSRITFIDAESAPNSASPEPLMVVIPITDLDERTWALICVERMPFIAYNHEKLQQLAVMADYVGDMLHAKVHVPDAFDLDQQTFMVQLERCAYDATNYLLTGRLVGFRFTSSHTAFQLAGMMMESTRGLDLNWLMSNRDGQTVLLVLLPLTGEVALHEYLERLESQIKERYGFSNFSLAGIEVHTATIDPGDLAVDVLLQVTDPCNVELADNIPGEDDLYGGLV